MLKDIILNTIQENPLMQYILTYAIDNNEIEDSETEEVVEVANFVTADNKVIIGSSNKIFIANTE